jgi:UDP-N-acetylmuramoylalanine--D-glutamate ligase
MANYVGAKSNILRYQTANDTAVLPADDPGALRLQPLVQGRLRQFSSRREVEDGAFVRDSQIWLRNGREKAVCLLSRIKLRGHHNLLNVLASVVLADTADISLVAMEEAIDSFHGVEHRLELIRTINGVSFVNDSIATAPERAVAAIKSYDEPIVLLAGGRDKDMEWGGWAKTVCERVRHVILFGELAEQLESLLTRAGMEGRPRKPEISSVNTVEDALLLATQSAKRGEVVLLSPGGTSFDAFTDFAERGTAFRELVMRLGT